MTQDEAKPLILEEMRKRLGSIPYHGADAGFARYLILKQDRPELFKFRCSGDPWQRVHIWMQKAGLVTQ